MFGTVEEETNDLGDYVGVRHVPDPNVIPRFVERTWMGTHVSN